MNFQVPIHYGAFTVPDQFEPGFDVVWPAPGIGDMQGGMGRVRMPLGNLNHFTATTGPEIVHGHRMPADLQGDLLFTEPVGRLIRRAKIVKNEGLTQLRNAYPGSEFLLEHRSAVPAGEHQDGAGRHDLHRRHVSGHHPGIAVDAARLVPARKIEQYQLDKVIEYGRIWRLRYDGCPASGDPAGPAAQATPDSGAAGDCARPDAAAHARRDAGAARRAPRAPERLVARHRAAAARAEAGQVGRARAPRPGRGRRQPAGAVPRAVDARRARRARRRARARADEGPEPAHAHSGDARERDALQGRRERSSPTTTAP